MFIHFQEPEENPTGCARSEKYTGDRQPYDMFSFLMSRYRSRPLFVPTDEKSLDMAHKSQRYKKIRFIVL